MRRLLVLLAACGSPADHKLPGASMMPQATQHAAAPPACEDDVAISGHTTPDVRYLYSYDALGRLSHVTGTYAAGSTGETLDYAYDNLGHMTHLLDVLGAITLQEVTGNYDTLGDLVDYTYAQKTQTQHYAMSSFTDAGQPTRQVMSLTGQPDIGYQLDYDRDNRLALAVQDNGPTTTYTYDDDGRTLAIDTGSGAFHGDIVYDEQNRELSETWGGTDPNAPASEIDYVYAEDRMLSATYRQGKPLAVVEVDTLRYDCDTGR
jgi:YD repeat-containing protein